MSIKDKKERKTERWDIYERGDGKNIHLTHCYAYNSKEAEDKAREKFRNIRTVSRLVSSRDIIISRGKR